MGIKKYMMGAAVLAASLSSCTNGFEEMNQNPWTGNDIDVKHQFTYSQLKMFASGHEGWRGNLIMSSPMSGISGCRYTAGNGFRRSDGFTNSTWELIYRDVMKNVTDANDRMAADNAEGQNDGKIAQLNIVKNVNLLRATLLYGDIPFFEAGKGYSEQVYYPEYDSQEAVLKAMAEEIKASREAIAAANADQLFAYDLYFQGDQVKWVKLANAYLMRIGLMMSAADADAGKAIFNEAYTHAGGYISTVNETALVQHSEEGGPWGQHVNGAGVANQGRVGGFSHTYMSEVTLKSMQALEDPRLFWVAAPLDMASGSAKAWTNIPNFDPFAMAENAAVGEDFKAVSFRGLRAGDIDFGRQGLFQYPDPNTGEPKLETAALWVQRDADGNAETNYGRPFNGDGQYAVLTGINPETILSAESPSIVMGSDEVHFMVAEASLRGWVGADAKAEFEAGVHDAIMKYPSLYPGQGIVDQLLMAYQANGNADYDWNAAVAAYVSKAGEIFSNPASAPNNMFESPLDVVLYQHWLSQLGSGYKAYALWNRTHFPSIVDGQFTGKERMVQLPVYSSDPIQNPGSTTNQFREEAMHTGGATDGYRPTRFPYPERELTVNSANANKAIDAQKSAYKSYSTDFITTSQWYSFRGQH
ncbi:SusD/RagB family nutrient-binding outer membrane lipoprotein [Persicobacter diffluens]|uniref:SusD/RagB family nutrient-binding outer membrane lipoprotein n=1 Tax=Persicobacter diffluens TaxID=981 RepID=A0AAN5ALQ4_9BACT|nr:hypothetical protein PEDI_36090 [Persicobacter diffluens]